MSTFFPRDVFSAENSIPRVMIAPARYIQGNGVLDHLGRYLSLIPARHVVVMISSGGQRRIGDRVGDALVSAEITHSTHLFDRECSYEAVENVVTAVRAEPAQPDSLIAIGGGKCIDAGKAIAFRLGVPVVVCPTVASTDAPTSAVAVMYSESGIAIGGEFYRDSPAMVVVDSGIIATAPPRFLAAGIADALASVYEIRVNVANPNGRSMVGGRPPLAVQAMVEAVGKVLFRDSVAAMAAVRQRQVTDALDNVIEANTLGSGIGFESGGLAVVHAIAKGLTVIRSLREDCLHGELVAIGILTQLLLLDEIEEAQRVIELFRPIGLPTCLSDLGLDAETDLSEVVAMAMDAPFVHNVGLIDGVRVSAEILANALHKLDTKH